MKIRHIVILALSGLAAVNLSAMKRQLEKDSQLDMSIVLNLGQKTTVNQKQDFPQPTVIIGKLAIPTQQAQQTTITTQTTPTLKEFATLFDNIRSNNIKAIKKSLKQGISLNNEDLLLYAITYNRANIIKLLIKNGMPVNPYHSSNLFCVDDVETARLLLDHGIDINTQTPLGNTPLINCAAYGNTPIVKELILHGADITIKNIEGKTAYDCACEYMDELDFDNKLIIKKELVDLLRTKESARTVITDHFAARFGQNVFLSLRNQQINGAKK